MHSAQLWVFALALFALSPLSVGLKAVVFTISLGYSHVQFDGRLADLLVDAGHEVVSTCF